MYMLIKNLDLNLDLSNGIINHDDSVTIFTTVLIYFIYWSLKKMTAILHTFVTTSLIGWDLAHPCIENSLDLKIHLFLYLMGNLMKYFINLLCICYSRLCL